MKLPLSYHKIKRSPLDRLLIFIDHYTTHFKNYIRRILRKKGE